MGRRRSASTVGGDHDHQPEGRGEGPEAKLDDPDDKVTLVVQMATLPDGALYAGQTTLDATAKNIKVVIQNSGHRPMARRARSHHVDRTGRSVEPEVPGSGWLYCLGVASPTCAPLPTSWARASSSRR